MTKKPKIIPLHERYPTGRKFCSECGRWRLLFDFNAHGWHYVGTSRKGDHYPIRLQARCKHCNRVEVRNRKRAKRNAITGEPLPKDLQPPTLARKPQHAASETPPPKKRTRDVPTPAPDRPERQAPDRVPEKQTHATPSVEPRGHYKPFIDWLESYVEENAEDVATLCSRAGTSLRAVYRHQLTGDTDIDLVIVERIGRITGNPDLVQVLYPQKEVA